MTRIERLEKKIAAMEQQALDLQANFAAVQGALAFAKAELAEEQADARTVPPVA